jgi:hypothetical protein
MLRKDQKGSISPRTQNVTLKAYMAPPMPKFRPLLYPQPIRWIPDWLLSDNGFVSKEFSEIRLVTKVVQFIRHLEEGEVFPKEPGYKVAGIGSDRQVHDIPRSALLNAEEIDRVIRQDPCQPVFHIVLNESAVWLYGVDGITFSRTIKLPRNF